MSPRAGDPNLWAADQYWSRPVRNRATEQEASLHVMSLNHPETIYQVCGKVIFHKTSHWCQKGWGQLF